MGIDQYDWRGLHGRLLRLPNRSKSKLQILVVYGQHAALERTASIAEVLSEYGEVWHVDMPGFGGMDSFYKIGMTANTVSYALYLHDFIKQNIGDKKLLVVGVSYGFANITRLLQEYPEHQKQVVGLISFVGFTGAKDFAIHNVLQKIGILLYVQICRTWLGSRLFNFQKLPIWGLVYWVSFYKEYRGQPNMRPLRRAYINMQKYLWRINDNRTHAATGYEFLFTLDLSSTKLNVPVYHLGVSYDDFFDHRRVAHNMRAIYTKVIAYELKIPHHAPTKDITVEEVRTLIPQALIRVLQRLAHSSTNEPI